MSSRLTDSRICQQMREVLYARTEGPVTLPHDVIVMFLSPVESEEHIIVRHSAFEEYNNALEYAEFAANKFRSAYSNIRFSIYLDGKEYFDGGLKNTIGGQRDGRQPTRNS